MLSSRDMKGEASGDWSPSFIARNCVCREVSVTPHTASAESLVTVRDECLP